MTEHVHAVVYAKDDMRRIFVPLLNGVRILMSRKGFTRCDMVISWRQAIRYEKKLIVTDWKRLDP